MNNLPAFSKDELVSAAQREDIIQATAAQIIKDFGEFSLDFEFTGNDSTFYDELASQLLFHVDYLIQRSPSQFLGLLYRIDIGEKEINMYEQEMKEATYPQIITELIIHRELKKVLFREYFRTKGK